VTNKTATNQAATPKKAKNQTTLYGLGIALLVVFSGFAFVQFNEALTPYVSYEQAIASARTVQVAGGLQKGSSSYDEREGRLHFTLVDTENVAKTLAVRYEGVKPANFEDAISIVAIGNWDTATEEFAAHDLLVKCPSKYQGLDDYESKSYSAGESQAGGSDGYGSEGYGSEGYGAEGYGSEGYGTEGIAAEAAADDNAANSADAAGYGDAQTAAGASPQVSEDPSAEFTGSTLTAARSGDDG